MSEFIKQENQDELFFPESKLYNLSHEVDEKIISAFLEAVSNNTLLVTVLDEIGEPCHLADADFNTLTGLRFQIKGKRAVVHEGGYTAALINGMKWFGSQIVDANREQLSVIHQLLVKLGIDTHADDIEQQYEQRVDAISQETNGEVILPDYNLVLENSDEWLDGIDQLKKYEEGDWSTNQDANTEEEFEPVDSDQIVEVIDLTEQPEEALKEKKPAKEVQKEVAVRILEEAEVPDHLQVLSFLNQFQVNFKDRDTAEMLYEGARVKNTEVKELLGVLLDFYPDVLVGSYISDRYKAEDQNELSRLVYRYLYTFNDELKQIGFRSGSPVSQKWTEMVQALTRFKQEYTTREDVLIAWKDAYGFKKNGVEKWYSFFKDNDQDKLLSGKELDFFHDFLIEQKESMWEEISNVDNLPVEGSEVHLDDTVKYLHELYDTLTLTGDAELQNKHWLAQRIKAMYKTYTAAQSIPTRIEMRKESQRDNDLSALGEFEEVLQLEEVFAENIQEYNQIKKIFLDFITENLEGKPKLIQEKVLELLQAETSAVGRLIAIGLQKYVKPLLDATQKYVEANYSDEHQQAVLNLLEQLISTQETLKYETIRERHQEAIDLMSSPDIEPEPTDSAAGETSEGLLGEDNELAGDTTPEQDSGSQSMELADFLDLSVAESLQDLYHDVRVIVLQVDEYMRSQLQEQQRYYHFLAWINSISRIFDPSSHFSYQNLEKELDYLQTQLRYKSDELLSLLDRIIAHQDAKSYLNQHLESLTEEQLHTDKEEALADFDEEVLEHAEVFSGKANNILCEKVGNGHRLNVVEAKPLNNTWEDIVDDSIKGSHMLDNHDLPIVEMPVSSDSREAKQVTNEASNVEDTIEQNYPSENPFVEAIQVEGAEEPTQQDEPVEENIKTVIPPKHNEDVLDQNKKLRQRGINTEAAVDVHSNTDLEQVTNEESELEDIVEQKKPEPEVLADLYQAIIDQNYTDARTELDVYASKYADYDEVQTFLQAYFKVLKPFDQAVKKEKLSDKNAEAFYNYGDKIVTTFLNGNRKHLNPTEIFAAYGNLFNILVNDYSKHQIKDIRQYIPKKYHNRVPVPPIVEGASFTAQGADGKLYLKFKGVNEPILIQLLQWNNLLKLNNLQFEVLSEPEHVQEQPDTNEEKQESLEVEEVSKTERVDDHAPDNLPVAEEEVDESVIREDTPASNDNFMAGDETQSSQLIDNEPSEKPDEALSLDRLREQTLSMAQDLKLFLTESKFNEEAVNLIQTLGNISWDKKVDHKDFEVTFGSSEVQAAIKQLGHNILVLHAQYQIIQFLDSLSKSKKTGALFVQHESVYNELQAAQNKEDFEALMLPDSFSGLKKKQQKQYRRSKNQLASSLSSFDPEFQLKLDLEQFRPIRENQEVSRDKRHRGTWLPRYQVENLVPETQSDLRDAEEKLINALKDSKLQNAPRIIKLLEGDKKNFKMKRLDQFYKQPNISEELRYVIDVFRYNYYLIENMKALVSGLKILSHKINPDTQLSRDMKEMYKQLLEVDGVSGLAGINLIDAIDFKYYLNQNVPFNERIDEALERYKVASSRMYINVQKVRELKEKAA